MSSPWRGVIVMVGESEKATLPSTLVPTTGESLTSSAETPMPRLVDVLKEEEMLDTFKNCGASM